MSNFIPLSSQVSKTQSELPNSAAVPASIAIRTSFAHHASHAGYKQVLRYTQPKAIFGVNEHEPEKTSRLKQRYHFLIEWEAKAYAKKHPVDVIHILYGEEYFRFSTRLFPKTPVIATFHQPPVTLQREVERGDYQGRIGRLTHLMNRQRFQQLGAAIVMTPAQKEVLARVMPEEKVHVIPLGTDLQTLTQYHQQMEKTRNPHQLLTVGNWMRDWDFYAAFVAHCLQHHPEWKFILVNRKLPKRFFDLLSVSPNVEIKMDISDDDLYQLYGTSSLQFLPFSGAAGNNSMNEGLALGCPSVTNILNTQYQHSDQIINSFPTGSLESSRIACEEMLQRMNIQGDQLSALAQEAVMRFDWSHIGQQTLTIYQQVL
ncbi:MAG: glycosyltransferase [Bacteroidota bacterium]